MITKEQLWYTVRIYPVKVSQLKARVEFTKAGLDPIDQDYWRKAAAVVNEIANSKD